MKGVGGIEGGKFGLLSHSTQSYRGMRYTVPRGGLESTALH